MLKHLVILICILSFAVSSAYADDSSNNDSTEKYTPSTTNPFIIKGVTDSETSSFAQDQFVQMSLYKNYKLFNPTVTNVEHLIDVAKTEPDILVKITRALLGHNISNITSSKLIDNVYYNLQNVLTDIFQKYPVRKKTELALRLIHPFSSNKVNPLFNDPSFLFYKIIFINSLYVMYINTKDKMDYDACIPSFFSIYNHVIEQLFGKKISQKEFEEYIFIGNLLFPFVLLCSDSENTIFNNVLNNQKSFPITYSIYTALKVSINFNISHIFDFSPIFAATSLISIYSSEIISPVDQRQIEKITNKIAEDDYKLNGESLNIYLALAVAEVSKKHAQFFTKNVPYLTLPSEISYSDLFDHEDPANNQQIAFSPGGFLLRSVAINAKNMFEYIIDLHNMGLIEIETQTLLNASINAVIYDRKTILNKLLSIRVIKNNQLFLQYLYDLAISNRKFIIASMVKRIFPLAVETIPQSPQDPKKKPLPTSTMQEFRFNIYRNFNTLKDCGEIFGKENHKQDSQ